MKGMADDTIGRDNGGNGGDGRRMRALAKRCITLTEENKVNHCPCNHDVHLRIGTYTDARGA